MEENNNEDTKPQTESSSDTKSKGSGLKVAAIVIAVIILLILGISYANKSRVSKTSDQVEDVMDAQEETADNVTNDLKEGISNVIGEINDLDSPIARLMLTKAYVNNLKSLLSTSGKEDLNTVIVYVEKTPTVLLQKNPTLPDDIAAALADIKSDIASAKAGAVATSFGSSIVQTGETLTITGQLEFVTEDTIFGGSVFKVMADDGSEYYLHLNAANSETANSLTGEEISIDVEITGTENGVVTYDVVSGPTAAMAADDESAMTPE